ncbi:hypothetical protein AAFF_G00183110 [Aldrovandia affinis]|uniref:Uncharacterized protein n=1 Tax=Aldrovandia affinis TaxID=143900 RepID=A0AAD7RK12_9TELE|nr:hypothetical protein AAFF_G00183110 [Aldrovandia affinis]
MSLGRDGTCCGSINTGPLSGTVYTRSLIALSCIALSLRSKSKRKLPPRIAPGTASKTSAAAINGDSRHINPRSNQEERSPLLSVDPSQAVITHPGVRRMSALPPLYKITESTVRVVLRLMQLMDQYDGER